MTAPQTGLSASVEPERGSVEELCTLPPPDMERAPLVVVAESADGDLLYDLSTGSFVTPTHW